MTRNFTKGEVIFREGDLGDTFFDIISGSVGIYTDYGTDTETKLTEIDPGHVLGELAFIDKSPRSATAVALDDVSADEVAADDVDTFFEEHPERVMAIIRELCARMVRLTDDNSEVGSTIKDLYPESGDRKQGIADKIKQFAKAYTMALKSNKVSVESLSEIVYTDYDDVNSKHVNSFSKGTLLFKEGERGICMYYIQTGSVNIYSGYGTADERLLTTVGVGKFFGEIGLVSEKTRTATAVVNMDHTSIESIYMDDLDELFTENPYTIKIIMKHLVSRIRILTVQYTDACRLIYEVSEAESAGKVDDALIAKVREYQAGF